MDITQVAAACGTLRSAGFETINQAALLFEIARMDEAGEAPTMVAVAQRLDMPVSTASRVIWELVKGGWIVQTEHTTDRRIKVLSANRTKLKKVLNVRRAA